eukprot:1605424-Ditylum_brightwellii.AAC.1
MVKGMPWDRTYTVLGGSSCSVIMDGVPSGANFHVSMSSAVLRSSNRPLLTLNKESHNVMSWPVIVISSAGESGVCYGTSMCKFIIALLTDVYIEGPAW